MSRYIYHILLILLICTLAACDHKEDTSFVSDNHVIEFSIQNDFAVDSKSIIDDKNYQQFGFIALGAWNLESWEDDTLFGPNGTEVKHTESGCTYSPGRYWQKAIYNFAGVMPSSLFAATYNHPSTEHPGSFTASLGGDNHNTLTLNFGDEGYNLATGQHDLMVAFDNDVDNTDRTMGTEVNGKRKQVSFAFEHLFSVVTIKAANLESNSDITIEEIKVYGNSTTAGDMVITNSAGKISASYETSGTTTDGSVYKTLARPTSGSTTDSDWVLSAKSANTSYETLISDLIVFPEECTFNISVTYKDRLGKSYTKSGSLDADWTAGKMYTYTFAVSLDKISFGTPTVQAWPTTSEKMDDDIEM